MTKLRDQKVMSVSEQKKTLDHGVEEVNKAAKRSQDDLRNMLTPSGGRMSDSMMGNG